MNLQTKCYTTFYLDQFPKGKIQFFTFTVLFQCIPWIILGALLSKGILNLSSLNIIAISIASISIILIILFINDARKEQTESRHLILELKEVFHKYKHLLYLLIISAFFILTLSYQLMPYFAEYTFTEHYVFLQMMLLGIGVGLGALLALLIKTSTLQALKIGYGIAFIYFLLNAFLQWIGLNDKSLTWNVFLIYSTIGGFLWIITIREFLVKSKFTEDGLILGLIESIQSLAEFSGAYLTSIAFIKREINMTLFAILLLVAFILVSVNKIKTLFMRNKRSSEPNK